MAEPNGTSASILPPEAIAFATRMYDAARNGQLDIFQQALPAGLPANMTNDKGDSLVCPSLALSFMSVLLSRSVSSRLSSASRITWRIELTARMRMEKDGEGWHLSFSLDDSKGDKTYANSKKIMLAAYYGHAPLVRLLLEHGANPNSLNDRGQSPLAGAVYKGEDDVIEALLEGNADPDYGDPSAIRSVELFKQEEKWLKKFEEAPGRGKATAAQ
ncbi:hypothetical protein ACMFMF_000349 [Clarireedia jacksonii]